MADTTEFDLVSPERLLLSEPVEMVVVPGTEGDFGVLPGHAPFISTLRPGVITVYQNRQPKEAIFVAGQYDDLPEAAFYMVGTMEEAVAKAKKMAAEAA